MTTAAEISKRLSEKITVESISKARSNVTPLINNIKTLIGSRSWDAPVEGLRIAINGSTPTVSQTVDFIAEALADRIAATIAKQRVADIEELISKEEI